MNEQRIKEIALEEGLSQENADLLWEMKPEFIDISDWTEEEVRDMVKEAIYMVDKLGVPLDTPYPMEFKQDEA